MKPLTTEQFNALPEERRKYWQPVWPISQFSCGKEKPPHHFTPIQINLEDAERVLLEAREMIKCSISVNIQDQSKIGKAYILGLKSAVPVITTALNNLKQLTK